MHMFTRSLMLMLGYRRRSRVSLWDAIRTPFRVVPTDLDLLWHMNNGKYLSILDLGRVDLMLRSGFWSIMKERQWYPVVVSQTITYWRSLKLGQRFEVETKMLGFDERSFYLEQKFLVGEQPYARAVICGRFLRKEGGSVSPAELEEVVGGFPAHAVLPDWIIDWSKQIRPSLRSTDQS